MAEALYRLGLVASTRSDATAISLLEESLALYREVGEKIRLVYSLVSLAYTFLMRADHSRYPRVRALLEESEALARTAGFKEGIAWSRYCLGLWHFQMGDASLARSLFEESLGLYITYALYQLGRVEAQQGNLPEASPFYQESVALFQELDDQRSSAACLEDWASVVARQGDALWAAQLWGAVEALRERCGPANPFALFIIPDELADTERMRARVQAELGEQAFAQALARGE